MNDKKPQNAQNLSENGGVFRQDAPTASFEDETLPLENETDGVLSFPPEGGMKTVFAPSNESENVPSRPESADKKKAEENAAEALPTPQSSDGATETDAMGDAEDYVALAEADLAVLREKFPAARGLRTLSEMPGAVRFAELRELGLSPEEAYLATRPASEYRPDNRAHLISSAPRHAAPAATMSASEMRAARELFGNLSDQEIDSLFRRATGQSR